MPILKKSLIASSLILLLAVSGCGSSDSEDSSSDNASPVSGAPRSVSDSTALSPVVVTPREPGVPFKGSDGKYIVSYELELLNPTPLTLAPSELVISAPGGKVIETLKGKQLAQATAVASTR